MVTAWVTDSGLSVPFRPAVIVTASALAMGLAMEVTGGAAYLAIFSTWAGTVVYYRLVDRTSVAFCSQTSYLIPIVAVALGALIFGEQLSPIQLVGFFAIIFGILIAEGILKRKKRRRLPTPPA